MVTKVFSDAELELLTEPSHYPHMQRAMEPLVIVNQHQRTLWHPRRLDLALATVQDDSAAQEGGTFREPAPARVPRGRAGIDLWPVLGMALVCGLGVPFLIAVGSEVIQFVRMVLP